MGSYGSECPSHGVYARVTEVKHWIQFLAQGAEDSNCKQDIPVQQALMITGGYSTDGDGQHTAEVWLPDDRSCQLPRLPSPGRQAHTQSSLTACGGYFTGTSCLTFDGEWEQSHSLSAEERTNHVSWQSPAGILLMGGDDSDYTSTELLSTQQ